MRKVVPILLLVFVVVAFGILGYSERQTQKRASVNVAIQGQADQETR